MTWGKVDPETLPDSVTCYTDSTIALPLLTAYALARHAPRPCGGSINGESTTTKRCEPSMKPSCSKESRTRPRVEGLTE